MNAVAETGLNLTLEECRFLRDLLQGVLKDTRIEERRTDSPRYREHVIRHEDLIQSVLAKLGADHG